ncbi:sodium- and chloride-dependent glycine transporter 1 isoform X2 [Parasteatoda tepidariorum]|uniref:sodium- and chloride-dependent glycine transporter 1 isoform X2 n=1 Tax=Parasteatoda tepidariorum TaxID=114398 RepID=UPI001C71C522|nr:sodium- and chloride-dependent glycine transporter 1 isoform X2 [Parasteatoda tepidariorum]
MTRKKISEKTPEAEEKDVKRTLLSNSLKGCISSKTSQLPSVSVPLPLPEDTSSTVSTVSDLENNRGTWGRQLDFFLSCVGYAVGLGNIWRFPYLCYQSGGGLGYGMVLISGIVCIYYNVIIAWTLYYMYHSYSVQWSTCGNWWNTPNCVEGTARYKNNTVIDSNSTLNYEPITLSSITTNSTKTTSSEEFWLFNVLQQSSGIDDLGGILWPLVLTLFIAWLVVFLCLLKGVKSSGKVVYVTATFPYVVLVCLLIRGITLPGAMNGILFYLSPRWELLLSFKVWGDAATQIFYSVGGAWGAVITMSSYNKFSNNVYRDSILIPIINCGTSIFAGFVVFSIIGFMAYETGKSIEEVVSQGPGLAFVVYPEAVSRLPLSPLWAFLFFIMLFSIGLDSQFGMFETMVSAFVDKFPILQKRKALFTAALCFVMFLLGLPCVTQGGMYVLQLMDWYSAAFSLMIISLLELICISWIYGVDRFMQDISLMIKRPPPTWFKLCWCYITPGTIICLLLFIVINHKPVTYGTYEYPGWSIALGWMIALCSILPIPVIAVVQVLKAKGTFKQRVISCLQPTYDWGPALEENRISYKKSLSIVKSRFPQNVEFGNLGSCEKGQSEEMCMFPKEDVQLNSENNL